MIRIFNDAPAVVAFGTVHMRTICLFYFLMAFSHCMAAVFRGAGRAFVPMYTMLFFWCFVRISYISLALSARNELTTISRAYPITWTCSCIVFLIYYYKADWMHGFESKKKSTA